MLETKTAQVIFAKLASAPDGWRRTREARTVTAKALRLVRSREGRAESRALRNLLTITGALERVA